MSKLNNRRIISVIDLQGASLQVKISKESQKVLIITTHSGYYHFHYIPFKISAAPKISKSVMDQIQRGIEDVT